MSMLRALVAAVAVLAFAGTAGAAPGRLAPTGPIGDGVRALAASSVSSESASVSESAAGRIRGSLVRATKSGRKFRDNEITERTKKLTTRQAGTAKRNTRVYFRATLKGGSKGNRFLLSTSQGPIRVHPTTIFGIPNRKSVDCVRHKRRKGVSRCTLLRSGSATVLFSVLVTRGAGSAVVAFLTSKKARRGGAVVVLVKSSQSNPPPTPPPPPTTPPPPPPVPGTGTWHGHWVTTFGALWVNENTNTGCFTPGNGVLSNVTATSTKLAGRWADSSGAGDFEFLLQPAGNFTGTFTTDTGGGGTWSSSGGVGAYPDPDPC